MSGPLILQAVRRGISVTVYGFVALVWGLDFSERNNSFHVALF